MNRLLVNPASGRGRARRALDSLRRYAHSEEIDLVMSRDADDLVRQAHRAVAEGIERLLVAGGDGTFHYVTQALAGTTCALALLPLGRGNDFAAELGVPPQLQDALQFAQRGPLRRIDLGRARDRYFNGYCGVGFDSEAAHRACHAPRLFAGSLAYVYGVLRTLLTFRPPVLSVCRDGVESSGRMMLAVVCNISRFGGGMRIAPTARCDDGSLDLVVASELSKLAVLQVFPRIYSGRHVDHPAVSIERMRTASIEADSSLMIACDGETIGRLDGGALSVSIVPAALWVVSQSTLNSTP